MFSQYDLTLWGGVGYWYLTICIEFLEVNRPTLYIISLIFDSLYSNTIMHFQERLISHGKERLKSYGCGKNAPYIAWYLQATKTTVGVERTVK